MSEGEMERLRGDGAGPAAGNPAGDLEAVERLREGYRRIRSELQKVIVGQDQVLDEILIGIFARGHCLLVGVPGLAKTLMISTLARSLSLSFSRIQFTPDLMPPTLPERRSSRRTGPPGSGNSGS